MQSYLIILVFGAAAILVLLILDKKNLIIPFFSFIKWNLTNIGYKISKEELHLQTEERLVPRTRINQNKETEGPPDTVLTFEKDNYNEDINARYSRLEILLTEKTKELIKLQTTLDSEIAARNEFGQVKTFLENEIHELRKKNRILQNEITALRITQPTDPQSLNSGSNPS